MFSVGAAYSNAAAAESGAVLQSPSHTGGSLPAATGGSEEAQGAGHGGVMNSAIAGALASGGPQVAAAAPFAAGGVSGDAIGHHQQQHQHGDAMLMMQQQQQQQQQLGSDEPLPASTTVLRLRGLPFTAGEEEVRDFFAKYPICEEPGSVCVITQGFHRGEGYVRFTDAEVCAAAHEGLNRANMGGRYIELYGSTADALNLQRSSQEQLLSEKRYYVRLRGLPFQAGEGNVREFLNPLGHQAVLTVHMCLGADSRFNGNAFVELSSEDHVQTACQQLNRGTMGARYIEIFESSLLERDAALNAERRRRRQNQQQQGGGGGHGGFGGGHHGHHGHHNHHHHHHGGDDGSGGFGHSGNYSMGQSGGSGSYNNNGYGNNGSGPSNAATAGGNSSTNGGYGGRVAYPVVRIRGLPFSANESTIAEFLSGVNIPAQGVHMVYNANERPTGEAFVEVCTEADVQAALSLHNRTLGRRYIEVFRSSQGEMHRLQMGEAPVPEGYYGTRGGASSGTGGDGGGGGTADGHHAAAGLMAESYHHHAQQAQQQRQHHQGNHSNQHHQQQQHGSSYPQMMPTPSARFGPQHHQQFHQMQHGGAAGNYGGYGGGGGGGGGAAPRQAVQPGPPVPAGGPGGAADDVDGNSGGNNGGNNNGGEAMWDRNAPTNPSWT